MKHRLKSAVSRIAFAAIVSTTVALCAKPTGAQTLFTLVSPQAANNITIAETGGLAPEETTAGTYNATINGTASTVFCTDLTHTINWGQSYDANTNYAVTSAAGAMGANGTYAGGLASALTSSDYNPFASTTTNQQRANEVSWLAYNYLTAPASTFSGVSGSDNYNINETAIQVSIWDILQTGGNGNFGNSKVVLDSSDETTYTGLVNYYENLAAQNLNFTSNDVEWIQAPIDSGGHCQDFLTVIAPEPGITTVVFAMAIALGVMFVVRKRELSN